MLNDLEEIKKMLDELIDYWREEKKNGSDIALYYVDAYQSVRKNIFDELKN